MHGKYVGEKLEENRPNLLVIVCCRWDCGFFKATKRKCTNFIKQNLTYFLKNTKPMIRKKV